MFGNYKMHPNSGVNPPYSPAYPVEWECALRTLEVMTRVDQKKVAALLADTPFELVNDRVAFRFMASPGHTLAVHQGRMFDLMVTVAVRYEDLFTQTHIYMYCSDPMGIAAGRELFGYTKKDCTFRFDEAADGNIQSAVIRRGVPLAEVSFTPDPSAPVVRLVDDVEQPGGEIHVRRLPHPERLETAYADIVYRRTPIAYSAPVSGRVSMSLHESAFDPLTELEPEILSAQFMVSDVYGGGFAVEDRRLLKRLIP
ncbi:acetoacetate decarboxylase family protein [Xanthobacter dioxanivorans]|uniref:Acetoacetate decarboxylase family protein n=1 Tax=Xanthobacter dioxanivorans TaxID=2528964 RepID=A0A974PLB8_9HYPH|nr:acetoacetate decarboxylase family protein [Xanthobacter dioxanivorans]QRG05715.1 acetoacetate decarboxylase family protein [Xanthobacter dioxanivorans]